MRFFKPLNYLSEICVQEVAHEPDQKYKEGMYVLERDKLKSSAERQYGYVTTPPVPRVYMRSPFPRMETPTPHEC